jgi:hypothetical protein
MSTTTGLEKLREHLVYTLNTGTIKNEYPASTFIIADPERAKSTETTKLQNTGTIIINDLTAWGLVNLIKQMNEKDRRKLHHIIIPDLERINARGRNVRTEILTTLHTLMQEGLTKIETKNTHIDINPPLKIGVVTVTTPEDVGSRNNVFRRASFISCFIPFSFDYSRTMKLNVLDFIGSEQHLKKEVVKIPHRGKIDIELSSQFRSELDKYAMDTARYIDDFTSKIHRQEIRELDEKTGKTVIKILYVKDSAQHLFGARAKEQYQVYLKSIAFTHGSKTVTQEHFDVFKNLYKYFNFNRRDIDSQEVISCEN